MKRVASRPIIFYSLVVITIVILFFVFLTPTKSTSAQIVGEKTVKSVMVTEGDSLWSIASEYYTELDGSMSDYMDEIRRTNQLSSDAIRAGNYLVIPYYVIQG